MAAVYGIIQNHGGWIHVDSTVNIGTTIRIYLPSTKETKTVMDLKKIESENSTETVLIVDDDEMVSEITCAVLERLGYKVLCAKTGEESIELAENREVSIDLAILDVNLPDMDGETIYHRLREYRPGIGVIVCSGYSQDGPAKSIMDAGAQAFLQKPISVEALSHAVETVLK